LLVTELVSAASLLVAVLLVAPDATSHAYAVMAIVAGVAPGLMLTGDIKLLNAGLPGGASGLKVKAAGSLALNVALGLCCLLLLEQRPPWPLAVCFLVITALGATLQSFSSVWFYLQLDRSKLARTKVAAATVKVAFVAAAVGYSEFTLALIGVMLGAMVEFALNFRLLPWNVGPVAVSVRGLLSPLGAAYGMSRAVSAGIRLGLGELLGALLASFLVIEQLIGGLNSLIDKYGARSTRWRATSRGLKVLYLVIVALAAPTIAAAVMAPWNRAVLAWLALVAGAGLLPLSEMYRALLNRGQSYVALGSMVISLIWGAIVAGAWLADSLKWISLAAYILLPGCTFLFYWLSSAHAGYHTERPAS
jgi:hypothetical protein